MKVMVIGGGGREHAIIKKLKENKTITTLYAVPGNGGMANDATLVPIGAKDLDKICEFAVNEKIDFAVVAPDDPLVLGLVDRLNEVGVECFGPTKDAAIIEGSKAFSKNLMKKYGIPTATYETFTDMEKALAYLDTQSAPIVIKADGLALGKGVIIAETIKDAKDAVIEMMQNGKFGASGNTVVIEEFLQGPEVSVLAFTDGNIVVPMVSSMDHKRAKDNDQGLNTGGMGTIAPNPCYTKEIAEVCMKTIFKPTIDAMNSENRTFKGCLYFGLMLTKNGPKVIEYNCRFGDPETQVVLPLMESDLFTVMQKTARGTLKEEDVKFSNKSACCVIMASNGYPESYEKGFEIVQTGEVDGEVYVAGAILKDGKLLTNGGRVLGVTAIGDTLKESIEKAYEQTKKVTFANAYYRNDIGAKALKIAEEM
ncbi:MAG: phosphoribosylamine--glycine ligase [Clostridia bacterium]|nr:phosphoribosylamine--glycine ligase [Clostridia bacterium]